MADLRIKLNPGLRKQIKDIALRLGASPTDIAMSCIKIGLGIFQAKVDEMKRQKEQEETNNE